MIILIGLPKSGTSSFNYMFELLGYNSYHWEIKDNNSQEIKYIGMMIYENKIKKKPLLNDFLDTDVITQLDVCINKNICYWPQIVDYKQLYKENPDSIFILNKRCPKDLLKSFKKWGNISLDQRLFNYSPQLISNKTDEGFINFVKKFYKDVEDYFSAYPNSKFITYNIATDNIEKLKKYIDIKNIKKFPHVNKNNN